MYEDDLNSFADVFELPLRIGMSTEEFAPLIKFNADYNFFFRGEFVPCEVLNSLNGINIALSSEPFPRVTDGLIEFTRDSISRYLNFRKIRSKPFDYLFHYDASSLPVFRFDGIHISGVFEFPVATSVYCARNKSFKWDIFFIGRSTSHRETYFGTLKHHYNFLHICHGIWGSELVDYMCSSKICLNIHAENEISWEPRMQMMLSCGVFVISEKIANNTILRPSIDYIEICNQKELAEAVKYYLNNDEERNKIAKNGSNRVQEKLNCKTQFLSLINQIDKNEISKFKLSKKSLFLNCLEGIWNIWNQIK
jgi:hypothetical protein